MAHIAHVDGKFLGVFGDAHVLLRQHERALLAVQRKHGYAVAHGQYQCGLWAIDAVAGCHLLAACLQKVLFRHAHAFGFFQHAENSADADVDVDVAGAIQRVKQQQVFALRVAVGHQVDAFHFFRGHGCQVAAPFVGFNQHFVGDDVQFFLDFALDVFTFRGTQHTAQRAFVDGQADALAGTGHHFQQQAQLRWNGTVDALLFDQVAGQ